MERKNMAKNKKNKAPAQKRELSNVGGLDALKNMDVSALPEGENTAPEPMYEHAPAVTTTFSPPHPAPKYTNGNETFINPYTFVPIPETEPDRKKAERGNRTGVIECSLEIKSPTFIPNTSKAFFATCEDRSAEHKSYEFYSYDDLSGAGGRPATSNPPANPVIPGSEIRGMIRNIYEQLTNSCFLVVDESNLPYKRTPQPKKAGILDKETKTLYAAERVMLNYRHTTFGQHINRTDYHTGDTVYISKTANTYRSSRGFDTRLYGVEQISRITFQGAIPGYVLIGEDFLRKHHDSVMIMKTPIQSWRLATHDPDAVKRLGQVLDRYDGYSDYEQAFKSPASAVRYLPVFYEQVGNTFYMSPAQMTKEIFANTVEKLLNTPENHKHGKCDGKDDKFCPACRLFGNIGEKHQVRGRVRFTDTYANKNVTFRDWYTLPILGTPHLSATEFYLIAPAAINVSEDGTDGTWNYDYYTKYQWNNPQYTPYTPRLAGRKVYWHGKFNPQSAVKTKMNQTVRPLTHGKFSFKVYFEDLTDVELSDLMFCLTLNGEGEHKIGRGKPVGMGDVKVTVENMEYREYAYSETDGFAVKSVPESDISRFKTDKTDSKRNILIYTKPLPDGEKQRVMYPTVTNPRTANTDNAGSGTYEWFGQNRGKVQNPKIDQILPRIDDNKTLRK
jgi:CRISPR-associated protein (TIGR03986 family)